MKKDDCVCDEEMEMEMKKEGYGDYKKMEMEMKKDDCVCDEEMEMKKDGYGYYAYMDSKEMKKDGYGYLWMSPYVAYA